MTNQVLRNTQAECLIIWSHLKPLPHFRLCCMIYTHCGRGPLCEHLLFECVSRAGVSNNPRLQAADIIFCSAFRVRYDMTAVVLIDITLLHPVTINGFMSTTVHCPVSMTPTALMRTPKRNQKMK